MDDFDRSVIMIDREYLQVCEVVAADGSGGFTVRAGNIPRLTAAIEGMGHRVEVYRLPGGWARLDVNRRGS